ncbi:MAG: glycoside hydrolase family 32 protein [Lachnospiraceae bacterium]|nr:glycoside hydrolase family 32 protein [Lachnospiraceae bacterium]
MTYSTDLRVPYLGLPVKTGQKRTTLEIFADNEKILELEIADLQGDFCDYYCWLRLPECIGKTLTLKGKLSDAFFALVQQTEHYDYEPITRPLLHFTAERGWLNDPNGMVYQDGVYHLYFQYNPADSEWGNMSWGHAESTDLLHFRQADTVLLPDENGPAFSGSGLVNERGLLGLPKDALVFYYTAAGGLNPWSRNVSSGTASAVKNAAAEGATSQTVEDAAAEAAISQTVENAVESTFTQRIAVSTDGGQTLNKLPKEAVGVIAPESRDPQVFWHEASGAYVMALWIEGEEMAVLRSDDLQNWEMTDRFTLPGAFECPNLFCLPVPEEDDATSSDRDLPVKPSEAYGMQWILLAADGSYYFGDFDGYRFVSDGVRRKVYLNELPYAAQIYNGISDRKVLVPWLRTRNEGRLYTGSMGLPRELGLLRKNGELLLEMLPVREYEKAKKKLASFAMIHEKTFLTAPEGKFPFEAKSDRISFEITEEAVTELVLMPGKEGKLRIDFFGQTLTVEEDRLCLSGAEEQTVLPEVFAELHLLIDRQIIEVYGNEGTLTAYYETGSDTLTGKIAISGFSGTLDVYQWK